MQGVKGQKMVQNKEKLCQLCSTFQESYITWFSFMVLMFKMIIPPGVFSFFKILIFWVVRGVGKRTKDRPTWQKNYICRTRYLRNHASYDCHSCCTCVNDNVSRRFSILSKFWFFGLLGGSKMTKSLVVCTLYLRNHTS